jgi:hypothetical protein
MANLLPVSQDVQRILSAAPVHLLPGEQSARHGAFSMRL